MCHASCTVAGTPLTGSISFAGMIRRSGQLEAALAASQADAKAISVRLTKLESQRSTTKARLSAAAKQHRRRRRQHGSLIKALSRSDGQKAALQQKALQLQQLLTSLMDMSRSMQQANSDMGSEMQLLKAELGKVQDQLAALQVMAEAPSREAGTLKGAEVAVNDKDMNKTLKQVRLCGDLPSGFARMCSGVSSFTLASLTCLLAHSLTVLWYLSVLCRA